MQTWTQSVAERLPPAGMVPNPIRFDDQTLEVQFILDIFCTYGVAGAPWLAPLIGEAVRQIQSLQARNLGAYAWARREFLRMVRTLERDPTPVKIPRKYRGLDPVAIMRANTWRKDPAEPCSVMPSETPFHDRGLRALLQDPQ